MMNIYQQRHAAANKKREELDKERAQLTANLLSWSGEVKDHSGHGW